MLPHELFEVLMQNAFRLHYVKLLAHPQLVCSAHTVLIPYAISFVHGSFLASLLFYLDYSFSHFLSSLR